MYKLITDDDQKRFEEKVNKALVSGWKLHGGPFTRVQGGIDEASFTLYSPSGSGSAYSYFFQAVTKDDE